MPALLLLLSTLFSCTHGEMAFKKSSNVIKKLQHCIDHFNRVDVRSNKEKKFEKYSQCLGPLLDDDFSEEELIQMAATLSTISFVGKPYHCSEENIFHKMTYREERPDYLFCHKTLLNGRFYESIIFFNESLGDFRVFQVRH